MKGPITAATLNAMGCSTPNCGHDHSVLYLVQRCHPEAYLEARYVKKDKTLVLSCAECENIVTMMKVR